MSGKKCPYCGRRIPYTTVFHEKKHGLYKCGRCKKESKIKTDFKLLIAFIAVVLIVVLYIILWQTSKFHNQFIGGESGRAAECQGQHHDQSQNKSKSFHLK